MEYTYNKLVRDKIPEQIQEKGSEVIFHVANEVEYWEKLKEKIFEEAKEFIDDESEREFADLIEVLDAVMVFKKFDANKIEEIRDKKRDGKGGFEGRMIVEKVIEK